MTTEIISQCSVDGCSGAAKSRGWCHKHYCRWSRHGDTDLHTPTIEMRFWAFVEKGGNCWVWTGQVNDAGYGILKIKGRRTRSHRVSFFIHSGVWPKLPILHSCDNPRCVNPDHLREGTLQENVVDMVQRNRQAAGERHGMAKLSDTDVITIRRCLLNGELQVDIAKRYNVSRDTIYRMKTGKTWKHI